MPQKKAKKAKAEKSKKPMKIGSKGTKSAGLGAAFKKAAKNLGKKVGLGAAKKASAPLPKRAAAPTKAEKPTKKKAEAPPKIAAPLLSKEKKAISTPALALVKGKKEPIAPGKLEGKKKNEVVVVVPAPKGMAILVKDGKKKSKSASESAVSKKNRCREPGCDLDFSLVGYCRMHYIKNWRRIKRKEGILASGQLNNYVEELVNKYPDKYLDVIREDLATEKQWGKVVTELELDGNDDDAGGDDDNESAPEGARPASGGGGGGRSEFDDEGDAF